MLLVKTKVKNSQIHGLGLFADEFIPKGTVIWKFTSGFDLKFTKEQILSFPDLLQIFIYTYAWKSKKSELYCHAVDDGRFFNHSENPNSLSEYRDDEEESVNVALRDIQIGEEITDNYSSFEDETDKDNILGEIALKYNLTEDLDPRSEVCCACQ
jgi:hypothetical protein